MALRQPLLAIPLRDSPRARAAEPFLAVEPNRQAKLMPWSALRLSRGRDFWENQFGHDGDS